MITSNFTTYVCRGSAKPEKQKWTSRNLKREKPVGRVASAPKGREKYLLLGYRHF